MIIKKNITLFVCEHCRKPYQRKVFAEKHEERCSKNPINDRPCLNCIHLEMVNRKYHYERVGREGEYIEGGKDINLMFCVSKNIHLYSPLVESKGNWYLQENIEDGEIENTPMPKQCDVFDADMDINNGMSSFFLDKLKI